MKAAEVIHDKNKKTINYKNAWLEVYDKPILYFPKFFHPDPTVKRQSGFLVPQFSDGASLGSSFQIPYFKIIAENKDLTFTPRIFANNNLLYKMNIERLTKILSINLILDFLHRLFRIVIKSQNHIFFK